MRVTYRPTLFWAIHGTIAAVFALLAVAPATTRAIWALENFPVMALLPLVVATRRTHPLTPLLYAVALVGALAMMVGGHWSYAQVPAGRSVADWFGWERNPYDRFAHVVQGLVTAIAGREMLLRRTRIAPGGWLFIVVTAGSLGVAALYELFEWLIVIVANHDTTVAYLATQGDPWDTQWDLFLCLVGTVASQLALGRLHDRQLGVGG